jgi:hypothetical protein
VNTSSFNYFSSDETKIKLNGEWKVKFIAGGPDFPKGITVDSLTSWTNFSDSLKSFSGTASYSINFKKPDGNSNWLLDLGSVHESAEVFLNGKSMGTLMGPLYQLYINNSALAEDNELEIQVSNLMANRIADLDRREVFWRKFYNVNFPARKNENRRNGLFDASQWEPRESGLIGPVTIIKLNP